MSFGITVCHIWDFVAFGIPLFVIMYVVHVTHVYVNWDYVVQYSVGVWARVPGYFLETTCILFENLTENAIASLYVTKFSTICLF